MGLHALSMLDHISQLERWKARDKWTARGREGGRETRARVGRKTADKL